MSIRVTVMQRRRSDDIQAAQLYIPPSEDDFPNICTEVTAQAFNDAATALGISSEIQGIAWAEALLGRTRLFVPQSLATSIVSGVARCELGMDPVASINFDVARAACEAMGAGWHLMSQAQHLVLAVISQAHWNGLGTPKEPRGNTVYGEDSDNNHGIRQDGLTPGTASGTARTLTSLAEGGGQRLEWSHDGSATGVFGMVGNVWKWTSRFRVNEGRIEVIPASAGLYPDHGVSSAAWRAIRPDGTLVATDAGGDMLHYDATGGIFLALARDGAGSSTNNWFRSLGAGAIDPVPPLLTALGLFPWSASVPTVGRFYVNTAGERLPRRGGHWSSSSGAGVAALYLNFSRASAGTSTGFRPAFAI